MSEKKLISIHELDEFVEIDESLKGVIEDAKKVLEMSDDELSAEMERIKQRNAERLKKLPDQTYGNKSECFLKPGALSVLRSDEKGQ